MKYMIASDIHGSSYYCQKLMDAYKYEKRKRQVICWIENHFKKIDNYIEN